MPGQASPFREGAAITSRESDQSRNEVKVMKVTVHHHQIPTPPRTFVIELTEVEAAAVYAACEHHGGDARAAGTAELPNLLLRNGVDTAMFKSRKRGQCYLDKSAEA